MVHVGKNTRSRIVSKGISAGNSVNAYRGLVQIQPTARGRCHGLALVVAPSGLFGTCLPGVQAMAGQADAASIRTKVARLLGTYHRPVQCIAAA